MTRCLILLLLTGCAHLPTPCVFGGTEAQNLACARRHGTEGELFAAQRIAQASSTTCTGFVTSVRSLLPTRNVWTMVTCEYEQPDRDCHALAVVESERGLYVLDNGAAGLPGDVMPLAEWTAWRLP